MKICFSCKRELEVGEKAGRTETCLFCNADLHCCLNCQFYDPRAYNQCREPQAERVVEKDRSNFCDYFSFRDASATEAKKGPVQAKKNPLDGLFKK
jgi:hypothetical protein